jgi:1-acyl-sn-glycerol-3-phosphate acyltransferase
MSQKDQKKWVGWSLEERDPQVIRNFMPIWQWFYNYYFRVKTDGWEHIPDGQVLLVGSHNGGLAAPDMTMMMYDWFQRFGTERLAYGLMHPIAWNTYRPLARFASQTGAIRAHPNMAIAAFERGASVLVYPGGAEDVFRPFYRRDKIEFAGRKGFIKLALRQKVPIVPLISKGAHETMIVLGDVYQIARQLEKQGILPQLLPSNSLAPEILPIFLGLPWGIGLGPLPNFPFPTNIHTRVCKPISFERYGAEAASDRRYVARCYYEVVTQMQQELDRLYLEA